MDEQISEKKSYDTKETDIKKSDKIKLKETSSIKKDSIAETKATIAVREEILKSKDGSQKERKFFERVTHEKKFKESKLEKTRKSSDQSIEKSEEVIKKQSPSKVMDKKVMLFLIF